MEQIFIENIGELKKAASRIIELMDNNRIFLFNGNMGAGKTTLIKAICEMMQVIEPVNSPTFSIVNEYSTPDGTTIFHFDCYRIKNVKEAVEIGAEEYLYSANYCFIEWAEIITPLLPDAVITINITETENGIRKIDILRN
jgi:tRNA threonylcarbamoyladenosine biosynthesis protein TsaE